MYNNRFGFLAFAAAILLALSGNAAVNTPPVVTLNPTNRIVCAGTTVTFRSVATGSPPPTVRWQVSTNGGMTWTNLWPIADATQTNYSFTAAAADNGKYYRAKFLNIAGEVTNNPALLLVGTTATPLTDQNICPGNDVTFSTTASGFGPFKFQWRRNNTAVPGATNRVLTLTNVTISSTGLYSVVITGACNVVTQSAKLNVSTTVSATPLTNLVRFMDGIAIFNGAGTAAGPFTYQWSKDGATLPNETNSSLVLSNLTTGDSGGYSVIVSSGCGSVTNSAALSVAPCFAALDIVVAIDRTGTMSGQPYTDARTASTNFIRSLKLGATNDQVGLVSYNPTATLNQTLTTNGAVVEQAVSSLGPATNGTCIACGIATAQAELTSNRHRPEALPVLVLLSDGVPNDFDTPSNALYHATQAKNAGTRIFTIGLGDVDHDFMAGMASSTNDYFYTADSSELSALFERISTIFCRPPTNIFGPSDVTVCAGADVTFNVAASGCASFTYQWRKNGAPLTSQTNNSIIFPNVSSADAGIYSVVVMGSCRTVTNSASLVVNEPAFVLAPPTDQSSYIGSNALFSVAATGTRLSYQWLFNGSVVGTNSTLALNNLATNDAGAYCVIVNSGDCGGPVTNCATLTILNRAPAANDDVFTTPEDTALLFFAPGVLANDTDPDGNPITALLVVGPTHGTVFLNVDGSFTYTPGAHYNGTDAFTYRASDGDLVSDIATATIMITPVNDVPLARDDDYTTPSDTTLTIAAPGALANDTDVENNPLSAILVSNPAHGTLTLSANGSFVYVPSANYSGIDTFTYKASDGSVTSGVATVTITVVPAPIVVIIPPVNQTNCPGSTAILNVTATGTALTYQWSFGTNVLAGETNSALALPNVSATNAGAYCVIVNGAAGGPLTNCAVLVVNENVIVVTPPSSQTNCPNTTAFFDVSATGTALTYQWYFGATALTGQTNSKLTLSNVTEANAGVYTIMVSGVCGTPVTNSATLTVNQNVTVVNPPVSQTRFVGGNVVFSVGATGTGLSYRWFFNGQVVGTNSALTINNLTTNQAGSYCVMVSGVCGIPVTTCTTLTIQNRAPIARDDNYTTPEDTTLTIIAPGVLANDSDVDGDTLKAVLVSGVAHGTLNLSTNGAFVYTPSLNYTGLDTFTYRATDGALTSGIATVTITITPVNDVPVAGSDDFYTTPEDTTLTIAAPGVLANDSDVDGDTLKAVLVSGVAHGTLNLSTNGAFVYTPSLNYTGLDTFTYRAADGVLTSGVATVTITITPVNDVPVAGSDDFYTTLEDTTLTIVAPGVLANDGDVDGDPLRAVSVSGVTHGTLNLSTNGAFVYTPSLNYTGLDTFTYRTTDGALTSGVATVTITITPVNDVPVTGVAGDFYTMPEDTTLSIVAPGVLANDSDVDGDALKAVLVSGVTHGTLNLSTNGAFIYTPSLNYTGLDTFTYRATDGALTSGVATVTITITPVNDVPLAGVAGDFYTTPEDTTLTIIAPGVLANDGDVDGDALKAVLVSGVTHGTLNLSTNGAFVYTPSLNYTGLDTFTYRATDGALTSGVATVTITITPLNDVPVAGVAGDFYTTPEDTTLTIASSGVLANDSDVDGDALKAVLVSGVTHGTLNLSTNGAFVYTPSLNYTGLDTFTYRATDGALTSGGAMVTITITPVNDVPVAGNDDFYTTLEDTTLTIVAPGVLANDGDVDGDTLKAVLVSGVTHGTLNLSTNGAFVYTPSLNYTGLDTFTYRTTDGALTSGVATVTITITPVNDVPVTGVAGDFYTMPEDTTLSIVAPGVLANDSDVDEDALKAVLVSGVTHGTLNLSTNGAFVYTPSLNYTGLDTFTYRATDGALTSGVATVTIRITPVNDVPVAGSDDFYTTPEDTTLTIAAPGVLANDSDVDGDALKAVLVSGVTHGTLNLSTNGAFVYTPSLNYTGLDTFTYRATDGALTSGVATVTITITPLNDVPVAGVAGDFYTTPEDTTLTIIAPGVLANDSDVDGDTLKSVLVSGVAHGTLNLSTNGAFVYTPSLNYTGLDTFTYRATDGALSSGIATVTITITPVNDVPVAGSDDFYTTAEDTTLTIITPGVLANDSDVDGDTLKAVLVSGVAHGTLNLSTNGAFIYTPSLNYTGLDTFTYRATDGALTSGIATVTITITPLNDVPVAGNDAYTTAEDTTLTITAPGVLANDSDVDGDPLRAVLVSGVTHGILNLSTNGAFVYTPSLNYTGLDTFTYRATDGALTSGIATVTITITPVNDVPVAGVAGDFYTTPEDTTLTIIAPGVLANDGDVDGDALKAVLVSGVTHGTLNLSTNGAFVYTPSLNYTGLDTFTYRATDGALTSGVATVTITITPLNDVPVAGVAGDFYTTPEDTTLTIASSGVLANDSDVDGDPLRAVLVSGVTHGTLNLSTNGAFVYTPSLNYTGLDTFTYRATDGALTSGVATVTITITPLNDVPVAGNDNYTTPEDTTLTIIAPGVLTNDSDVDGDTLKAVLVSGVSHGTLNLSTNGAFVYAPSLNYTGLDTFTYRATDGALTSGIATVTITITPVNDVPVAGVAGDFCTTPEDTALTIVAPGVLANDSDVDGDTLKSVLVSGVAHGTLNLSTNGAFVYTPSLNYTGLDTFTYRATDGVLTSGVATVTITITPVNDVPVAGNDAYTTAEDTTLTIAAPGVLANDSDVDGDTLKAVLVSGVTHGTLNLSTNGAFVYTPSLNYTGLDTFTYRTTDGALTSGVATVTITITPVNDVPLGGVAGDFYTTPEDTTLTIASPGVLANDSDVDGDTLKAVLVSGVTHGTLNLSTNGAFVYTPSLNYTGLDTFTYRATDGALTSGVATVTITITPVNDPPTAGVAGDTYSVLEDRTLTVSVPGVLANDSDVDGDALAAVLLSGTSHGTLTLNPNGSFSYTPSANYFGSDSFIYVANDGGTSSAPATVNITVLPVNDAPSFVAGPNPRVNFNAPAQTAPNWAGNISAGPANEVSQTVHFVVSNNNPSLFSVQPAIGPNGALTYTPAGAGFGVATVTVVLQDNGGTADGGVGTSAERTFTITLNGPPVVSIVYPLNDSVFVGTNDITVVAEAGDPDSVVTNLQIFLGTNAIGNFTSPPYFVALTNIPPSETPYLFHAIVRDDLGLSATSSVVSVMVTQSPPVMVLGPIVLNRQNGLFEHYARVMNPTPISFLNGVRLLITGLDTTNTVYNATGTNAGVPYIDVHQSLPSGGFVDVLIQYYVPNPRSVPTPTLIAEPLPFETPVTPAPMVTMAGRVDGGIVFEFTAANNRLYCLQASEDFVHWNALPGVVQGTGGTVQRTNSLSGTLRFFRVLLLP